MDTKIELLMKLTELSEQIRHSKKHRRKHDHCDLSSDKNGRDKKVKHKLSFTAKRTICILLEQESINQRSISKMLGVSAQTVSEMIKNLEAKEIIVKSQGEVNNENIITLSEKGKALAVESSKRMTERAGRIFNGLSDEEVMYLKDILVKISENNLNDVD